MLSIFIYNYNTTGKKIFFERFSVTENSKKKTKRKKLVGLVYFIVALVFLCNKQQQQKQ